MLALLLVAPSLAAEARLEWRGGVGQLVVEAPGEHVAPDAPTTLTVGEVTVELRGDPAALRFPVAAGDVRAEVRLALCADGSTSCRPVTFVGGGAVAGKRGAIVLAEAVAAPRDAVAPTSGVVKVLDFGAVWCPPCNLMEAEVLHDPAGTGGLPVETIDVDKADSWALKDRYAVGGYPTLVAVDATGAEVDRLVGYPGAVATRTWFANLREAVPLDVLARDVSAGTGRWGELAGSEASAAARRLAEAGREDAAARLFERAADGVDLRVARLLVRPSEADARWLFEHDAPPGDWVYAAVQAAPGLWSELVILAPQVPAAQGADYLYAAAEHAPAEIVPALKAASLAVLRAALTGDPARDRGHVTFLATLLADTGDLDGAVALLDDYAARFPDEFTFPYAAARQLLDAKRLPEAEAHARLALDRAWGDQRLRAAGTLARVLAARGNAPEALRTLEAALAEVPAPPPDVEVRTTRYRADLEKLRAEIGAK